jgi:hypothetical protein
MTKWKKKFFLAMVSPFIYDWAQFSNINNSESE